MTTTNRLLLGALAGIAGTFAMTAAARAMHRRLPPAERYPLPPREIFEGALPAPAEHALDERAAERDLGRALRLWRCDRHALRAAPTERRHSAGRRYGAPGLDCELLRHHARSADPATGR